MEKTRVSQGGVSVVLISSGDDTGGSTSESMANDDDPILKVMAATGPSIRTVGNREFDKDWVDPTGYVSPTVSGVDQLGTNVYLKGARWAAPPLEVYTIFKVEELGIAVIGIVTGNLPSLASLAGISDLIIDDPVDVMNETVF